MLETNGNLILLHPGVFLSQADTYFQFQSITDLSNLNIIRKRLVGNAKHWFDALIFTPFLCSELVHLFCGHT